jgi:hypothetical protein
MFRIFIVIAALLALGTTAFAESPARSFDRAVSNLLDPPTKAGNKVGKKASDAVNQTANETEKAVRKAVKSEGKKKDKEERKK